ncbi:MAG: signal recognition particle-docking protein FtsY [Oligoflexales bacterium]|nr:signal recognition particle-docking protein FtsY [Oligoflexales bacterium]
MDTLNPIEVALNFSKSLDAKIVIGVPIALLFVVAAVYYVMFKITARRERHIIESLDYEKTPPFSDEQNKSNIAFENRDFLNKPNESLPAEPQEILEIKSLDNSTWIKRLRLGLSKTRDHFSNNLAHLFQSRQKLTAETLEKLHEVLYRADLGVATVDALIDHLKKDLSQQNPDWLEIQAELRKKTCELLDIKAPPLNTPKPQEPLVILIVGVNGVGKTTTIGKLTAHFLSEGKSVLLGAGDTYRAAAIDQLKVWGERLQVDVIAHQQGSDPAAVAFDAVKAAKARNKDVLIIDTAGRLHNKEDLMNELSKINKVISKELPGAPHETWLVIDATTGQNAYTQVKAFREVVGINGIIVTKLDGTAKGGVLIGISHQYKLPIRFVGIGEKAADLRPFNAIEFANSAFS